MSLTLLLIICIVILGCAFCFCLAIANFGVDRFFDIYKKYNEEEAYCSLSVVDMVNEINAKEFNNKLRFHKTDQLAGDAYIRGGDMILSTTTLSSTSIASYTVLAHEFGHALQDRDGKKLKVKSILNKIGKSIGWLMFPSIVVGIILIAFGGNLLYYGIGLVSFGFLIFLLSLTLRLFIISIEKDASRKAMLLLKDYFSEKQLKSIKKLLNSAKLTYWASFFRTLLGWTTLTKGSKLFD